MSGAKEIRSKIRSINSTRKITRAMEMVAASKMRKAQDRMLTSRPYSDKIRKVIGHLAQSHPEYQHPYLQSRTVKRVGYIVVSSDRGLCGGLNINLIKTVVEALNQWRVQGIASDLCLIGNKATAFFRRVGANIVAHSGHVGDNPQITDLIGLVKVMLDAFDTMQIDAVYLVYNQFVNTMIQKPYVEQLLPLVASDDQTLSYHWDYIYEPDARELLDMLLTRYIESQVYQGVVENIACEQAARMIAMKNASENAGEIIGNLQLAYNKARQASITQELAEIVAGAAAV